MGKLTLLLVAAAVVGGSALTLSVRSLAGETARGHAGGQASVLARQIAESGQGLMLAAVLGDDGFVPTAAPTTRAYEGGEFTAAASRLSANGREVTLTVEGRYGGAVHTIETTYAFDPMTFPGPVWLDVPYATATVDSRAEIAGGPDRLPVRFDARKFDDTALNAYLSRTEMTNALAAAASAAGSTLSTPAASAWAPTGPLLEDLSLTNDVGSGEDLFQVAVAAKNAGDQTFAGNQTVSGARTWGGAGKVTHVEGDLTVVGTGRLSGEGALLVEGALTVRTGGRLAWDGLVIVRADRQVLPVALDGTVEIAGGLVVVQEAAPPGGHMDLTVMRRPTGMGNDAVGQRPGPNWPLATPSDYTWYEHTHRFDIEPTAAPRGTTVHFAENGAGRHEQETRFWSTLADLGSTPVVLEFPHRQRHGSTRFALSVRGEDPLVGTVRGGFGAFAGSSAFRTRAFPANDLRGLTLDVRSPRGLQNRFDGEGTCVRVLWPLCVGERWDRANALTLRMRRASNNAVLYDAAMYWHMNQSERAEHVAAEAAWAASVRAGSFGTTLRMGPNVRVAYSARQITRLADKLGFDGNEVHVVATASAHTTAAEMRAAALAGGPPASTLPPGTPAPTVPAAPPPTLPPPTTTQPIAPAPTAPAPTAPAPTAPAPEPTAPEPPLCSPASKRVKVCRKPPPGESSWNDFEMRCDQVSAYLLQHPGSVFGTCSANNL